jgi:hypothetical protein
MTLAPGARSQVWVLFGGLAGLPTTGAAAARLQLREAAGVREIPLVTPGRPGPVWYRSTWYAAMYLRSGIDTGSHLSSAGALALETLFGRRGFLFGTALALEIGRIDQPDSIHDVPLAAFGARAGWMSRRFGIGGVLGVDYRTGKELTPSQPPAGAPPAISVGTASVLIALRWNIVPPPAVLTGPFALNAPRSPLGRWAFEIGYVRWLSGGSLVEGGGVHVALSASLGP